MVQADVRHDAHRWKNEVCTVQRPAETSLDDGDVDPLAREVEECERKRGFIITRPPMELSDMVENRHHFADQGAKVRACDRDPIYFRAFRNRVQMRFGMQPNVEPGALQHVGDHRARRAFAARARDVNGTVGQLRIAQFVEQSTHALESARAAPRNILEQRFLKIGLRLAKSHAPYE